LKNRVIVIGLGYVGLPVAVAAAKSGCTVIGIDLNTEKVDTINRGISPVEDINNAQIQELISNGLFRASSEYAEIRDANIVLICVPTPLLKNQLPDLSMVESAARSMSQYLMKGVLVILESTVAPGTTRDFLAPLINSEFKIANNEIQLAFSPERIDPLNKNWNLKNTPKIVAGLTDDSRKSAVQFYSKFVDEVIECDSLEIAETAKLLENSFRLINISFINELSKLCYRLGIEVSKVINAAATKPYGFMPFYPSIGVGGHCIPVDPLYLSSKALEVGSPIQLIDLASQINLSMPQHFVLRAEEKLGELQGKRILVVGVSYKQNVSDVRETPVEMLILGLRQKGARVFWHDDFVKDWKGEKSVALTSDYDLAIIATPHDYLDLNKLGDIPMLNTRESV
jgi:UDP-N-acetyl-D-glucosamine dehydrogenase